jgi:threonylcarbamoyladenosine tRNA methylthiotransferase MtaB
MTKNVFTFGCRLNSYESEVIKQHLADAPEENVAVFNTCAVTKEAERQAKQSIRKFIRENPDSKVVVTGCAAQIDPKKYAEIEGVDQVLGNEEKLAASSYGARAEEKVLVNDIMSVTETVPQMVSGLEDRTRAFMQVQNGCDHRCTFCIIPYGRGNSRSVPVGEIVKQAQILVDEGYNEIVLTGVDISGYGADLPGTPNLGGMMRRLLKLVPGLQRLRLSSIDVAEVDEDLLDLIENEPRLMPYMHLSLQAGDDMILKRMKRRHNRAQVLDFCEKTRKLRPDMAFGADIIAGFPTETDDMFENTFNIVAEAGLSYLHVFPYSEREGTPAANIPANKQVDVPVRKARAARLRAAGNDYLSVQLNSMVGNTLSVIVEHNNVGRAENFAMVALAKPYAVGSVVTVTVDKTDGKQLFEAA